MDKEKIDQILNETPEERLTELTDKQKKAVMDSWNEKNPPTLKKLAEVAWGKEVDPRTWQGRLVRDFLASQGCKPELQHKVHKKAAVVLTEEQKEYIVNHCRKMSNMEMARELFNNPNMTPLHYEFIALSNYVNELNPKVVLDEEMGGCGDADPFGQAIQAYKPPKTEITCVARINQYIFHNLNATKLTSKQKKCVDQLISYLHCTRFNQQINTFTNIDDRILFESEFIRCTYDKDDLSSEEVDQYIVYATEVVIGATILKRIERLEREQDNQLEGQEGENAGRINMALVEAVKGLRTDFNACGVRQEKLLKGLKGERRERLDLASRETASILNLVQLWKESESRKQLLDLAFIEQEGLKREIDRLTSIEEVKAKILGLSEDEILYG